MSARFSPDGLPVAHCLPQLLEAVGSHRLVALSAPAGSGKTLLVPLTLFESCGFDRVYVLEPRRVTARLPALALRQVCGDLVGYRIRLESLWSQDSTRIGYLTYGTALNLFFAHPPKKDDLLVFDEFHERTWESELLLAYLRQLQAPPKILLMSATLDTSQLPVGVPLIESKGRLYPVEIEWEQRELALLSQKGRLAELVARRSAESATKREGEQLIFLPGLADIRAVAERLKADRLGGPVDILHSSLAESEIRRVVERPSSLGFRRILATDIAESSVTLPGITTVIDSGLVRRPQRDDLDLGITLRTIGAPLSALTQRAGRAGRLGPGHCHRLFTQAEELHRAAFPAPEIKQADFKTMVLLLARARLLDRWNALVWLQAPPAEKLNGAIAWARQNRLIDSRLALTPAGRSVLELPLSPRVANFARLAREGGHSVFSVVSYCQALENPPRRAVSSSLSEWSSEQAKTKSFDRRLSEQLQRSLEHLDPTTSEELSTVLLRSFSDTVAEVRATRAVCALPTQSALSFAAQHPPKEKFILILATAPQGGSGPKSLVTVYCPLSSELLWEQMIDSIQEHSELSFDSGSNSVRSVESYTLGSLVLEQTSAPAPVGPKTADLLYQNMAPDLLSAKTSTLFRRLELLLDHEPQWNSSLAPLCSGAAEPEPLKERLIRSFLATVNRFTKASGQELHQHVEGLLPYALKQELRRQLPLATQLPGRRTPTTIHYRDIGDPYISSKLQDFFGWTPIKLLHGTVPLVCHLLAPNGRACQITTDLETFWSGSYQQVRKDLRGRYPKHHWPERVTADPSGKER